MILQLYFFANQVLLGVKMQNFWQLWSSNVTRIMMFCILFPGLCRFFFNLEDFLGIFSEISLKIAIVLIQKSPYFGFIDLDLVSMSKICLKNNFLRTIINVLYRTMRTIILTEFLKILDRVVSQAVACLYFKLQKKTSRVEKRSLKSELDNLKTVCSTSII